MNITFRQATVKDCHLMRDWIKQNEFTRHWYYYDKVPHLTTLEKKMEKRLKESKTHAMIILVDDKEIGYIQSYPVDSCGTWGKKVRVADNMISLDYFIGDLNYIHKGLGTKILLEFIEQIVKKENYKVVLITPDPENRANCRCVEKCGFKYIKTVNVPYVNSKEKEAIYIKEL